MTKYIDLFQELSSQYPVLFLIDDTLQPKYGKKFAHVKVLHDHALHRTFSDHHAFRIRHRETKNTLVIR